MRALTYIFRCLCTTPVNHLDRYCRGILVPSVSAPTEPPTNGR